MCSTTTAINTLITSQLQRWNWSISSDSITVHSTMSYGILLHEGYDMSKTGDWLIQMQEEAQVMNFNDFLSKWGEEYADLWTEQNLISILEDYND